MVAEVLFFTEVIKAPERVGVKWGYVSRIGRMEQSGDIERLQKQ